MTIIDVGQYPDIKGLFLSGQLNIAVCPQCGRAGMLSTPIVYHDPEKELLFTYMPSEMGLADAEQQRVIGDLTTRVMSSLPAEQRKGYLLRPRSFLRMEAMIEAVLEADGVTPEMLEAQRAKAALLERLARAPGEEARRAIVRENDAQIDYEFFQLLTLNLEMAQAQGQEAVAQQLLALRRELLAWTTEGQDIAAREEAIRELGPEITREELLEKLVAAALAGKKAAIETMVAVARPAIDYVFYQALTERIENEKQAGNASATQTLTELRNTILDLTRQIDAEVQAATEQASQLLQQILSSDDPERAVRTHLDEVDEFFLQVLGASLQAAERAGQTETRQKLTRISDILMKLIEESQPPEIRFINQLIAAGDPESIQALLDANRDQVDAQFLELVRLVGEDLVQSGRQEAADRLAQVQKLAAAMVG